MQNDQPRPELDAAIDAVVPSLTAVSDDAAAASLRRTRTALAEGRPTTGLGSWRWAVPAAAVAAATIAALGWWTAAPTEGPQVVVVDGRPQPPPGPRPATTPPAVPSAAPTPKPMRPVRPASAARVQATSTLPMEDTPRPDPLIALVRAVQAIPEGAWRASVARAESPVAVLEIEIAPIDTPPVGDVPAEPIAPGEP